MPLDGAVVGVRVLDDDSGMATTSVGLACVDAVCLMVDVESEVAELRVLEALDVLLLVTGVEEVLAAGVLVGVTTEEVGHVRKKFILSELGCNTDHWQLWCNTISAERIDAWLFKLTSGGWGL